MRALPKLEAREEHFRIPSETNGLTLFLRYLGPSRALASRKTVLYIHGATFPSALSIAHRFDGYSWRDDLNAVGYHVWGLDFLGFGASDRYPEMSETSEGLPALSRAEVASWQIERAVGFILKQHGVDRISLIAHSWGSMPTGLFAGRHPEQSTGSSSSPPLRSGQNNRWPRITQHGVLCPCRSSGIGLSKMCRREASQFCPRDTLRNGVHCILIRIRRAEHIHRRA
jgi:pimeloyl-ACP methyl ester carboxylesterase